MKGSESWLLSFYTECFFVWYHCFYRLLHRTSYIHTSFVCCNSDPFSPSNYFPLVTRSVFAHSVYTYRIECYFEDTLYLHLGNGQSIPAKTTGRIEFTFNPQEPRSYHEEVELVINGIYKEKLEVKGKGVEIKVSYPSYFLHYRAVVLNQGVVTPPGVAAFS